MGSIMYQGASPKIMYQGVEYSGSQKYDIDCIKVPDYWKVHCESPNSISWIDSNSKIQFTWGDTLNIGADIWQYTFIPSNAKRIRYKFTTGTSYSTTNERFKIVFGLTASYPWYDEWVTPTSSFLKYKKIYNTQNTTIEDELEIPQNNADDLYIAIGAHGWNMTIDSLKVDL